MNVDIFYYTGTGNTARAVDVIKKEFSSKSYIVRTTRVDAATSPPAPPLDLAIIAFPVYAWMAPVSLQRFLRKFPRGAARCAVVAVRGGVPEKDAVGGYSGGAIEQVERILTRKGYEVTTSADAGYPDNWTQFVAPLQSGDVTATCSKGDDEIRAVMKTFKSGKRSIYRAKLLPKMITGLIAALFLVIGRKGLGSCFIADEKCNSCGICAKHCPTRTIVMRGKKNARPFWRFTCEACNRCINICPKHSIQLSLSALIMSSVLTGIIIAAGIWSLRYIAPFYQDAAWLRVLIHTAAVIAVVIIAHIAAFPPFAWAVFMLTGFPAVRRFFSKSHTQSYGRYCAPGFKVSAR